MQKIRHYENLHIPLWLLKDTCWMLQWKIMGAIMIIPTITIAIIITIFSFRDKSDEFWINMAICFWIGANSYWMICEFTKHEAIKDYAGFPFLIGIICVAYFYIQRIRRNKSVID
jgi:hypothetical protein